MSGDEEEETQQAILLVEDDPALALGLCDALEFEGFRVVHAKTGQEGIAEAASGGPDAIILDLMLPDMNGYQVCTEIRKDDPVIPIIMLTARSQEADKIRGLESGADDYVTKPFSVGELVARIRAIFRRAVRVSPESEKGTFRIGESTVDPTAQTLTQGRKTTPLSFYETELLRTLHDRAGAPISRDEILDKIWGLSASPSNRTVDNFVVKLRKKIEPNPNQPRHILTVYGVGYKLVL